MNWKKFKNIFNKKTADETYFILGIDLGNDSSIISYFDIFAESPEIIDISGGYGKPSLPTVVQYIPDNKEWVFGEYALLNKGIGKDITLFSLMERLGKKEYLDIDSRSISIVNILSLYLKELIGNVKNINPKAEIVGIIVSVPSYLNEEAMDELLLAFKAAGYDKEVIQLLSDRECIFNRYYFENEIKNEKIMVLDFASREIRGGVYEVIPQSGKTLIKSISSLFDINISTKKINQKVLEMFTEYYCRNLAITESKITPQTRSQISSFVYQHKDLLFQKNISLKPIRLYFNFAFPPFQQNITKNEIDEALLPYYKNFKKFVERVLEKNVYDGKSKINSNEIDTVICVGGGFEMLWAKSAVQEIFNKSKVIFYKNSKGAISEGAAILAAKKLGVIEEQEFITEDINQLDIEVGIKVIENQKEKFIPIVERNSFWWQNHKHKMFILHEKTDRPVNIGLYKRNEQGDINYLKDVVLEGLPSRPKGTTKIKLKMHFESFDKIVVTATDCGFGELFPKTDYEAKTTINIKKN